VSDDEPPEPVLPRPFVERAGLAAIALVLASLFGGMGLAAWIGHEVFLAVMAWIGALMTLWAAGSSLRKG
jgi:hypothetical protein